MPTDKQRTIPNVPRRDPFFLGEDHDINEVWLRFFQTAAGKGPELIEDTHAKRSEYQAARHTPGSEYYETDRTVTYRANAAGDWIYSSGTMRGTLSPDQKPSDLGTEDEGFLFYSTDFLHLYRWSGSAWGYADQSDRSARHEMFFVSPGSGWKIMDGTGNPVTYSTATGGTATITLPNAIDAYPKGAATPGTAVIAASGALSGSITAEAAHTHDVSAPTGATTAESDNVSFQEGSGAAQVLAKSHIHGTPALSVTSAAGSSHTHAHTLSASGVEPAHFNVLPCFRL